MKTAKKPQVSVNLFSEILKGAEPKFKAGDKLVLLAIRGYFKDEGVKGKNDRGIYDDALVWCELETGRLHQFNGNCDPSKFRQGSGTGSKKGMARLKAGVWRYKTGMHYGSVVHAAFRQADKVTVIRDGLKGADYEDTGMFGINVHKGGAYGTSSLGCLTVPPQQWDEFKETGYALVKKLKAASFPLVLVEVA